MDRKILLSKFQGSVFAALAGDCIGAQFEPLWSPVPFKNLKSLDDNLRKKDKNFKELFYTDDTEMAHVLANSLIQDKDFVGSNIVKRFAETFEKAPSCRWYGGSVGSVFFKTLRKPEYANQPFKAAAEQFDGSGSYGNGSAMRVFPVALYYHKNHNQIEKIAALSARLTHAHIDAVNGAIIQAMAVEYALSASLSTSWENIWNLLKAKVDELESGKGIDIKPYTIKFENMFKFLQNSGLPSVDEVKSEIGTGIKATEAVCCAIYAFLCCLANKQPDELAEFNKVQQTIFYAIMLGGDTDTIATMAGAIAGAFYGHELVPLYWLSQCEGKTVIEKLATDLFESGSESGAEIKNCSCSSLCLYYSRLFN